MDARRAGLVVVLVVVIATLGAPVGAQFGNPLGKLRPQPKTPDRRVVQCGNITDDDLEQLLKALEAERAARAAREARQAAADQRQKATEDAINQAGAERMMAAMARQDACEEAAKAKDPRTKEADRLSDLRNRAQDRGDEATADKLGEQFAELTDAIEKAAKAACLDPACLARARQESPLKKQIEEMRAAAAKSSNADQKAMFEAQIPAYLGMIEVEALNKCGPAGAGAMTADEQARTDAAVAAARRARDDEEGTADQRTAEQKKDDGRIIDCACGVLGGDAASIAISGASRQVIEGRRGDLGPVLKASGKCGKV
jgi:hypothetical protein